MTKPKHDDALSGIQLILKTLPHSPGIYKFIDKQENILYIGKAKDLKKRVSSYFNAGRGHSFRIQTIVLKATDIRYTITNNETEALLLENNLIKEYQPRYNILLKDGKSYPYLCIKNERFPRIFPTRKKIQDGSTYFGPYASVKIMNALLELIQQNFKLRTCTYNLSEENVEEKKYKLCLEYQIGNCAGPCEGLVPEEDYEANIQYIRKLLKGNLNPILDQLQRQMKLASNDYKFEEAEALRIKISQIKEYKKKSTVFSESISEMEVVTVLTMDTLSIVNHFKLSNGRIIQTHSWEFRKKHEEEDPEILSAVIRRLKADDNEFGNKVLVNLELPEEEIPEGMELIVPKIGDKKKLIDMSLRNCKALLEEKVLKQNLRQERKPYDIMEKMKEDLRMKNLPKHIECFDNSNIQGNFPVASLVVFKQGKPAKKDYRHYKIKTVEGPDDYASMEEVVFRRYRRLLDEKLALPDLIIVDGGKGQLSSAAEALSKLDLIKKIPIMGIAKKLEEIYVLNDPIPLHLDKRGTTLKLIQQIRNEAHRFAIIFHRNLRSKSATSTVLSKVKGVGEKTAQKILQHFKSVKKLKSATESEIEEVLGRAKSQIIIEAIKKGEI